MTTPYLHSPSTHTTNTVHNARIVDPRAAVAEPNPPRLTRGASHHGGCPKCLTGGAGKRHRVNCWTAPGIVKQRHQLDHRGKPPSTDAIECEPRTISFCIGPIIGRSRYRPLPQQLAHFVTYRAGRGKRIGPFVGRHVPLSPLRVVTRPGSHDW